MKPKVRAAPKAAPSGQELELLMRKARGEGGGDDEGPPEPSADAMPGLGFSKCAAQSPPEDSILGPCARLLCSHTYCRINPLSHLGTIAAPLRLLSIPSVIMGLRGKRYLDLST